MGRSWAILLTSIRKVCKFVHFTGGEKVSNFAHFSQESVQICSLYWWGEGEQFCSLQSGKCANLFTLLVGRRWAILLTSVRKVCKFVHFTGGEKWAILLTSIRKVCKFVHFTGGEKVSNFAHFNQESVQICSLYWWGEGEQFCSLQVRKVCKFVHFTGGEKVSNFAHFSQESVQICSLYWWGEGEQFCSLQSGKCANLFTLLVGRRWAILLTSIRKVCKFVHFTGGEKVSNFAHFSQESVQICSLYWWGEGEQFCSLQSGKCANLFTLLVGKRWAIFCSLQSWGRWANLYTHWGGREICTHWIIFCCFLSTRSQICKKLIRKFAHL